MNAEGSQPFLWTTGQDPDLEYQKHLGTGGGGAKVHQVFSPISPYTVNFSASEQA